jgi:DNA-binding NtrC family response regulator
MMLPRILVIDDQFAREKFHRAEWCDKCDLVEIDITTSDEELARKAESNSKKAIAGACFTSGQVEHGQLVENSLGAVRRIVQSGWPNEEAGWRWALILLDLQFNSKPSQVDDNKFGLKILDDLVELWPDREAQIGNSELPIIMLSTTIRPDGEEPSNRRGARAYVEKEELTRKRLKDLLDEHGLVSDDTGILVGRSHAFLKLLREARRVAKMRYGNALILGPTGSGKTDLALYVHRQGPRKEHPFIKYPIRATAESTEQANLFGYWEGAFTGASSEPKAGEAELANKGILFLDEVHNLTTKLQSELLTYARPNSQGLREVRRMGGLPTSGYKVGKAKDSLRGTLDKHRSILVNVLLLAATNEHLDDPTWRANHNFREDLYRRLATDYMEKPLRVPSLAERKEDIPILFKRFLEEKTKKEGWRRNSEETKTIEPEVLTRLMSYSWPGNIAELHGVAHSVAYNSQDFADVFVRHLPILEERRVLEEPQESGKASRAISTPSTLARTNLKDIAEALRSVDVPRALPDLDVQLGSIQDAFDQLVKNVLEVALEEAKFARRGKNFITPALNRLFPHEITKTYQAYRKLHNLSKLFKNPPAPDSLLAFAIQKAKANAPKAKGSGDSKGENDIE